MRRAFQSFESLYRVPYYYNAAAAAAAGGDNTITPPPPQLSPRQLPIPSLNISPTNNNNNNSSPLLHQDPEEARKTFFYHGDALVIRTAIWSRILVAIVGTLALNLVGAYDSSTNILLGATIPDSLPNVYPFTCSANWDGAYFTRIAEQGYRYEQAHAFFPLMPLLMRTSTSLFFNHLIPVGWFPSDAALLAFVGAILSNAAFVLSAVVLFHLSDRVLNDSQVALRAALLYCFNPASIFFSVAYAEAIFALLTFTGMLLLTPRHPRPAVTFQNRLLASLLFGLATTARSNGALLGIHSLYAAFRSWQVDARPDRTVRAFIQLVCVTAIHFTCLLLVLGYGWLRFCYWPLHHHTNSAAAATTTAAASVPVVVVAAAAAPWCSRYIPNIYSYIEEHYWEVAPFQYYQQKQIPNFILALPIISMSLRCIRKFRRILPGHSLQLTISVLIALVVMNVQVSTRFICASCPILYWFAARSTTGGGGKEYFTLVFFSLYTVLGSGMFCAFYPWT
jgi:phosphatidylinositol glycan class V